MKQEDELIESVKAIMQVFNSLDTEILDDSDVDYKKLYYRAFNGLTEILEDFGYPKINNLILKRIVQLQQELEELYIEKYI